MKNCITILFLLISFSGYSQIKLESGFGLEYSPKEAYKVNDNVFNLNSITMINQMRLVKNNLMVVSNISIMMERTANKITFTPSLASFNLELRYIKNKFMFSISHLCIHPISTAKNPLEFSIYGGYDFELKLLYNIK